MRSVLLFILCASLVACETSKTVFQSGEFDAEAHKHKTIAVLPLKITQTGKVSKKESPERIKETNDQRSYVFQEALLSYALAHTHKNKRGPMVSFQAPHQTNALLKEAGLTTDSAYNKKPGELARLLGVDAVVMTTLENDKNFSDEAAYKIMAGRFVFTVATLGIGSLFFYMNASELNMNSYLYDTRGKMLWKTFRKGGTDSPAELNWFIHHYTEWIAKQLPYRS